MSAKFLVLRNLLRILTPDEINELSSNSTSSSRINLTELLSQDYFAGPKAMTPNEAEVISLAEAKKQRGLLADSGKAVGSSTPENDGAEGSIDPSFDNARDSASLADFLFNEKEKLHKNVIKIKHKELLQSYKKNAELDIEQQKRFRDDLSKSSSTGILINKKQA